MHEVLMRLGLLALVLLASLPARASTNVALEQFLKDLRGSTFNMLVARPHVVVDPRKRRTRNAVDSGYMKELRNMEILLRKLEVPAMLRAPGMLEDLPQSRREDEQVGKQLLSLIEQQTNLWETRLTEEIASAEAVGETASAAVEEDISDDIGADLDFDTDLIETTDDTFEIDKNVVTPGGIASTVFLDVGQQYARMFTGQSVKRVINGKRKTVELNGMVSGYQDIYAPFNVEGMPSPLPLHAVFGTAFMPDKVGAIHVMRMYVFVMINDPEIEKVRVAAKPVPRFRWDRNEYYISAATGSVLRSVFSEALGVKVEDI